MPGRLIDFGDLLTPSPRANVKNRFRATTAEWNATEGDRDPALGIPGMPPGGNDYLVPHAVSYQGIFSSVSRVYRISDEALKESLEMARYMVNDPVITEPVELRQRSVALLNWNLEPEDKRDPTQKWLCERLTAIIKQTPHFMQYRESLARCRWFGRYGVQHRMQWKETQGQRRIVIGEWKPVHGDKLVFRYDDGSRTYDPNQVGIRVGAGYAVGGTIAGRWKIESVRKVEPTDYGLAYFLSPWERSLIAIGKHSIEDGEYEDPQSAGKLHGVGIRSKVFWCWYQKQELQAQLFEFLERSASGIEIWFYPWGNKGARETVKAAAEERIGENRNVILVPRPEDNPGAYGYDRIEPSMAGAEQLKSIITDLFNMQIKKYVLGQTLTTEQGSTGLGSNLADIHLGTFHQIVKYDSLNDEETLTTDLVRPLQKYNFPKFCEVPIYFRIQTEDEDAQQKLEAIQAAYEMKVPVKMASVYDALGEEKPEPTDAVLEQPAEQPMMGGPGPGAPGEQPPKAAQEFGGLGGEEQVPSEEDQAAALDQAIELDQGQEDYAAATDSQNSNRIPIRNYDAASDADRAREQYAKQRDELKAMHDRYCTVDPNQIGTTLADQAQFIQDAAQFAAPRLEEI